MGKWITKYDDTKERCRNCGKRLRRGTVIYKEFRTSLCRDCGRIRDRKAYQMEKKMAAEKVRKNYALLPEHAGAGDVSYCELKFEDGGSYKGEVMAGKMHGKGTYVFRNGDTYSGTFIDGRFEGKGAFIFTDGEQHAGEFSDDRLNGRGYCIFPDGSRIEGLFEDDQFIKGKGFKKFDGDVYRGEFGFGAVMEGYGVYSYHNGEVFIGEFKKDEPNGLGRLVLSTGKTVDGMFADGILKTESNIPQDLLALAAEAAGGAKRNQTQIEYPDGTRYSGSASFGIPDGDGAVLSPTGTAYTGTWYLGRLESGIGRLVSQKGTVFEGNIGGTGKPDGEGAMKFPDGTVIRTVFKNGRPADGPVTAVKPDGKAARRLYLSGNTIGERAWWDKIDSEDEDDAGTNLWMMGSGMSVIPQDFPPDYPSLGTVMLAESVKRIASFAFAGVYIRRIIIPESVKKIDEKAFADWGPSQTIVIEGDVGRFQSGWNDLCDARVVSLHELIDESSIEEVRLERQKLRFGRSAWYEGDTLNGEMHGHGIYRFENGDRYEGEFRNGSCCGWGTCVFGGVGKYRGEFRDDRCNGAGTMFYEGGDRYIGEWKDGRRSGWGKYIYSDGEIVEGRWQDGAFMSNGLIPAVLIKICPSEN